MLRKQELHDPHSCLNRARDDEPVFVLLGRDASAPDVIRRWAADRVERGKNNMRDAQITEALQLAEAMERYAERRRDERVGTAAAG